VPGLSAFRALPLKHPIPLVATLDERAPVVGTESASHSPTDLASEILRMKTHKPILRRSLLALTGVASMSGLIPSRGFANTTRVLLINPNSNQATTDMMVRIAQSAAPDAVEIVGATAPHSPMMIVDTDGLAAAAPQVVEIGLSTGKDVFGIIISAFGDPGFADLQRQARIPVVGIAEASMLAASEKGRHFGVATTTPKLVAAINARAAELGVANLFTGVRLTSGDPVKLATEPDRMTQALKQAVTECIELDKAEAVVIGGGPLGNAATALTPMFSIPVIAPIPAAVHRLMGTLALAQK
jgi:allantoin racemase